MNDVSGNRDKLREAGLIGDELHTEHEAVIDELSPEEVDMLIRLKERLDERGIPTCPLDAKVMFMPVL
jgi:hypothetical protein